MEVEFISELPREKARPRLDTILSRGSDQLVIGCAFCTGAGVQLLQRHVARLANPESFLVVAAAEPTDYAALGQLHAAVPDKVFVHWGAISPVETKVGTALMHSKVFYARSGTECWLWTGSHNLTGNATQGANCEAAILLHGNMEEKPFADALRHLKTCRNEARLYDPNFEPPRDPIGRVDIVVIHAETQSVPSKPFPWHVHLCLDSYEFDKMIAPPAGVRLFLHPAGSLTYGWRSSAALAVFEGSLTGENLTARNPRATNGVLAEWQAAAFSIEMQNEVLSFGPARPPKQNVTTQAVFSLIGDSNADESLFSEAPRVEYEAITTEEPSFIPVDEDMKRFYKRTSLHGNSLIHRPIIERNRVIKAPADELRTTDYDRLQQSLSWEDQLPVKAVASSDARRERRHPFIFRAKYRL